MQCFLNTSPERFLFSNISIKLMLDILMSLQADPFKIVFSNLQTQPLLFRFILLLCHEDLSFAQAVVTKFKRGLDFQPVPYYRPTATLLTLSLQVDGDALILDVPSTVQTRFLFYLKVS